jgi:hypothetical protein
MFLLPSLDPSTGRIYTPINQSTCASIHSSVDQLMHPSPSPALIHPAIDQLIHPFALQMFAVVTKAWQRSTELVDSLGQRKQVINLYECA